MALDIAEKRTHNDPRRTISYTIYKCQRLVARPIFYPGNMEDFWSYWCFMDHELVVSVHSTF